MLEQKVLDYIEEHAEEARELLITLAQIPSPSNHEEKEQNFAKNGWKLREQREFSLMRL